MIDLDAAYDVLVRICGAREDDRRMFLANTLDDMMQGFPLEYRFQGALGFGGKFRIAHGRVYVDCYPEDETDERRGRIAVANHLLAELADQSRPSTSPPQPRS